MSKNKPRRLSEVVERFAPQGSNDKLWFLVEHQLEQAKLSAQTVVGSLELICLWPEDESEREIAMDCLDICKGMYLDILEHYATFGSYLAGTDVLERISRKEL